MFRSSLPRHSRLALLTMFVLGMTSLPLSAAPLDFDAFMAAAASGSAARQSAIPEVRLSVIRQAAMSMGARAGLAHRAHYIRETVEQHAAALDAIYAFPALMLPNNIVPPVLDEGNEVFEQKAGDVIRIIDKAYRIVAQARVAPVPPTWRTYLIKDYSTDADINATAVKARDDEEAAAWARYLREGWAQGERQAEAIFGENLSRLKRDFEGMARYRLLLAKGMVTPPYVASAELGTTGNKAVHLNLNETVLRITAMPEFILPAATQPAAANEARP